MADEIPTITESQFQAMKMQGAPAEQSAPQQFMAQPEIPTITESQFEQMSSMPSQQQIQGAADYMNRGPLEKFRDYGQKALQGVMFGGADEAISAVQAPMEVAKGYFTGDRTGLAGGYERALEKNRANEAQFEQMAPTESFTTEMAGALAGPSKFLSGGKGLFGVGRAALGGAAGGGAYGFLSGEGGLENRTGQAIESAGTGAILGGGLSAVGKGLKVLGNSANAMSDAFKLGKAGITKAEAGAKSITSGRAAKANLKTGQHPLVSALDELDIKTFDDKSDQALWTKAMSKLTGYGEEIGSVIDDADNVLAGTPIIPNRSFTDKMIQNARSETRPALRALANKKWKSMLEEGDLDGSLKSVQRTKIERAMDAWTSKDPKVKELDKAIASDLRQSIEDAVDDLVTLEKLPKEYAGKIKTANAKYGDMTNLEEIFRKKAFKDYADDVVKTVRGEVRTSGGSLTTPTILGAAQGAPVAGQLAGLGLMAASTRTGKAALEKAGKTLGAPISATGKAIGVASGAAPFLANEQTEANQQYRENRYGALASSVNTNTTLQPDTGGADMPKKATLQDVRQNIDVPAQTKEPDTVEAILEREHPIIKKIIEAESSNKPKATSPKGAMGLMQLMPGTAKDMGVTDPYDPVQNLKGGIKYFKKQVDRFKDVPLALAAYNWGPENVKKLIDKRGTKNWLVLMKDMPAETENYMRKILGLPPRKRL